MARDLLKEFYNNSRFLNAIRYKITPFMIKRKIKGLVFDGSRFFRLNLNCRGDAYYGYVNIEDRRTKARVFVSLLHRLPFLDNTVKFIIADFETIEKRKKDWSRMFKEWSRVLVVNGILVLDNIFPKEDFLKMAEESGFIYLSDEQGQNLPVVSFINNKKTDFCEQNAFYYKIEDSRLEISSKNDLFGSKIDINGLKDLKGEFNVIKIEKVLEYLAPEDILYFLNKVSKILKKDGLLELKVDNEIASDGNKNRSFFDKSNLSLLLTETGFAIERIEKVGFLKASIRKKRVSSVNISSSSKRKVCFIEQFLIFRHNQLGFDNDAIARASEELGLDALLIEGMRNIDFDILKKAILLHKPEYLIVRLKEILPFISYIKGDLNKIGAKVAFWFCDPEHPEKNDLSGLVDYMFLSNRGQIDEYKRAYNLDRVYYMPQGYDHHILGMVDLPKQYDVGFVGALSAAPLHKTRRELIKDMADRYNVKIKNNIRNDISEFYSESKTIFGVSDFDYELYTSNRFFIALGCGACYVTKRFKGIELLVENKKHALYFEEKGELFSLLDYYLSHDNEREKIRKLAIELALKKHTYVHRIKNILDILDGKTEDFYGFL
ncbi:MAG: glycosyltransferase [Candidatus Omnitrophota bacterium]